MWQVEWMQENGCWGGVLLKQISVEAVRLTRECLAHFWQGDVERVINLLSEDVVWVGARQ